jgi:hypothetical protein
MIVVTQCSREACYIRDRTHCAHGVRSRLRISISISDAAAKPRMNSIATPGRRDPTDDAHGRRQQTQRRASCPPRIDVTEENMRITVKLDGFEGAESAAYAILWLDKESRRWSREGHQSVEVPDWGNLRGSADGTVICCQKGEATYCVLEQLDVEAPDGPCEGLQGRVIWYADGAAKTLAGRWHIQCVDRERIKAEHGVFAGEQDAWSASPF